jgi:hypothetical protein
VKALLRTMTVPQRYFATLNWHLTNPFDSFPFEATK